MDIKEKISFGKTLDECKKKGFKYLCKEKDNIIGSCCDYECDKRGNKINGFCKLHNVYENYNNYSKQNKTQTQKQKKPKVRLIIKILILIIIITIFFSIMNCKNI